MEGMFYAAVAVKICEVAFFMACAGVVLAMVTKVFIRRWTKD